MAAPAPHHVGHARASAQRNNGIAVTAVCCGLAGILIGLIPILFQAAGALGIVGIVLGFIGLRRVSRGESSNQGMAIAGLVTGILALGLAVYGLSVVVTSLHQLEVDIDHGLNGARALTRAQHVILGQETHVIHRLLWIGNG
ncbi:MAG: DUF4190 domain-containing protein [Streptosporangiales bacterium]|nr:DUF4190 domain-containing protein [Streptosporangiales bacterium]